MGSNHGPPACEALAEHPWRFPSFRFPAWFRHMPYDRTAAAARFSRQFPALCSKTVPNSVEQGTGSLRVLGAVEQVRVHLERRIGKVPCPRGAWRRSGRRCPAHRCRTRAGDRGAGARAPAAPRRTTRASGVAAAFGPRATVRRSLPALRGVGATRSPPLILERSFSRLAIASGSSVSPLLRTASASPPLSCRSARAGPPAARRGLARPGRRLPFGNRPVSPPPPRAP